MSEELGFSVCTEEELCLYFYNGKEYQKSVVIPMNPIYKEICNYFECIYILIKDSILVINILKKSIKSIYIENITDFIVYDNEILAWNNDTLYIIENERIKRYCKDIKIKDIVHSNSNDYVLIQYDDGRCLIYNHNSFEPVIKLEPHNVKTRTLYHDSNKNYFIIGSDVIEILINEKEITTVKRIHNISNYKTYSNKCLIRLNKIYDQHYDYNVGINYMCVSHNIISETHDIRYLNNMNISICYNDREKFYIDINDKYKLVYSGDKLNKLQYITNISYYDINIIHQITKLPIPIIYIIIAYTYKRYNNFKDSVEYSLIN